MFRLGSLTDIEARRARYPLWLSNQTSVERLTGRSQRQIGSSNDPANNDLTKQIRHS
jgi:hypothetical protein